MKKIFGTLFAALTLFLNSCGMDAIDNIHSSSDKETVYKTYQGKYISLYDDDVFFVTGSGLFPENFSDNIETEFSELNYIGNNNKIGLFLPVGYNPKTELCANITNCIEMSDFGGLQDKKLYIQVPSGSCKVFIRGSSSYSLKRIRNYGAIQLPDDMEQYSVTVSYSDHSMQKVYFSTKEIPDDKSSCEEITGKIENTVQNLDSNAKFITLDSKTDYHVFNFLMH